MCLRIKLFLFLINIIQSKSVELSWHKYKSNAADVTLDSYSCTSVY